MKKLLILLLFSYSIANAQLPTWVYGNQVNIGGRDTSVNAGLKLFINGRTTGKYLKNSGWGVSSFGNIESADVPWGGGFTLYDVRYVRDQRFLDSIAAVRAAFNSINLDWNNITGKPALLIAGNNLADVSNVATARTNLNVYSKMEADARYLQSFTESDPVWTAAAGNYYTKTQADARYLQSFTETDPTVYAWAKAATKPAYAVAEITGLQTALDGKEPVLGFTPVPNTRTINGYALSANISLSKTDVGLGNVPNIDATNPANISQSASYRFVTDTEKSTWNAKQNALGFTPENAANKGVPNGYAALGSDSKILAYQLPQVAINQTFTVNSQSAMLALSANQGDIAVRTDQNKAYILAFTGASTLANWIALPGVSNEADPVFTASVAFGITGTNVSNWNTAFGWGNHAGLYRPVSWVPSWTDVTGRPTALSAFTNDLGNYGGWITGINSSMVTTALGYTPANSSSLSSYALLSGATFTGNVASPNFSGTTIALTNSGGGAIQLTGANGDIWMNNASGVFRIINQPYSLVNFAVDQNGGGSFRGAVAAASFSASGNIFGTNGIFSGNISANQGQFGGAIDAWGGTFQRPIYVHTGNGGYSISAGGSGGDYGSVGYNLNYTGTTNAYNYRVSDFASFIRFQSGGFQFFTASSGTSGTAMSPVNRYTMDVNGNNSWSGNATFGGYVQINNRNQLYLANSANTLFPSIRNMDGDGIGIYTNAGSALLEASTANGISTNGRAFVAGSTSVTGLTVGSVGSATIAAGTNNLLVQTSAYTQVFRRDGIAGIFLGGTSDQSNYYDNNGHVFRSATGTEWMTINSGGITTNRAIAGTSASLSGRMNADDYDMGSWRILDWAGVVAQIGGISNSQWQQIDFFTNGTVRGSFTNTAFVSTLPGSFSGGTAMTSGWNRTLELNASFPVIVFNSASQKYAGIGYDFSSNMVFRVNANSNDIFSSGIQALQINSSTGAVSLATSLSAPTGNFTSTTASSSTTTGALTVAGGVGIAGAIYAGSGYFESDERLKDISYRKYFNDGFDVIKYTWKQPTTRDKQVHWGYSAQQLLKVLPEAVSVSEYGYYSVDYNSVHTYEIMKLKESIMDLHGEIFALKIKLNDLKAKSK